MTLVKVHTCSKCGGALKVNDELQKYECPFCGISYEYEYFQKKVILEMAESSLRAGDFPFAEKRYLFALKKQPHDPRLLQGRILSHARLDRVEKTLSIPDLIGVDYPNVERAMKGAEESAFPEDKEYFGTLHDAFRAAEELEAIKKTRSELESRIKADKDTIEISESNGLLQSILSTIGNILHSLFSKPYDSDLYALKLFFIFYVVMLFVTMIYADNALEDETFRSMVWVFVAMLLIPLIAVLILNIHVRRKDKKTREENIRVNTAELEKTVKEEAEKEKELSEIIERLGKMDLSKSEGEPDASDHQSYEENLKEIVTCPSCDGELIDNQSRALYECPFCGLTFDYEYVRHDRVLDQAEKALLNKLYHEAELFFSKAEENRPGDFRVLRGYMLCGMKVPKTPDIKLECDLTAEELADLRMRVDEVIRKAPDGDKEYFKKYSEIVDIYEEQLTIQKEIAEPLKKIHDQKRKEYTLDSQGNVNKPRGGKPWSKTYTPPKVKFPNERVAISYANKQNRELKTRVLEIRTALVEIEKAHGLPKELYI
ncbi:MAG TPA: hypothetical protein DEO39_03805 [Clostridiales bacterium]|nr:hypothetical protein [Clostridiales bacterium]